MNRAIYLAGILAFGLLSTAIHFSHNFVELDEYPESVVPDWVVRTAIVVSWPVFAAVAVHAYRLYAAGDGGRARPWLVAFGLWALAALGHFLEGNPDIPPVWYATIWTDVLAGVLVLAFVVADARRPPRHAAA